MVLTITKWALNELIKSETFLYFLYALSVWKFISDSMEVKITLHINSEKLRVPQILNIREEHESKELNLKAKYDQELRQDQIQAENELKEVHTDINS